MGCMEEKGELHEVLVPWWLQHRTPVLKHSWSEQEVPRGTALGAGGGSKRGIVKVGNIKCESWSICFFIYIFGGGGECLVLNDFWRPQKLPKVSANGFVLCFGLMSPRFSVLSLPLQLLAKSCWSDRQEKNSGQCTWVWFSCLTSDTEM